MLILLIGGAGYIGSHMVKLLQKTGCHVVVLDDLSNGFRDAVPDVELVVGSIADAGLLKTLFARYQFDAVIHFASFIQVGESISHPQKYYENNADAIKEKSKNYMEKIKETNTEKLIDFGTVILMPENQVIHKVVGYLSRGDKTFEINSNAYNSGVLDSLTRREKEVLTYVSKGKSSQEIAVLLQLSIQTVKIHRKNILKKLEVNSSIQAIAMMESIK